MLSSEEPEASANSTPADPAKTRDRKFWTALALFIILAAVIWFTFGEGTVFVFGRQVQLRVIPLFVIGTFVFRTIMAREADKIRRRA